MSIVTNAIITASTGSVDRNALSWLNEQLEGAGHPPLMRASDVYDSAKEHGKAMEALVAIGAFNHLDVEWFAGLLDRAPWENVRNVRLFLQVQDVDFFRLVWP